MNSLKTFVFLFAFAAAMGSTALSAETTHSIIEDASGTFPAPPPESPSSTQSDAAMMTGTTGLFWNANESGWGMAVTQHGSMSFVTIYTYDASGLPLWYTMSSCPMVGNACTGDIYGVAGGKSLTSPWAGATIAATKVGSGTLTFSDVNSASFVFTINGVQATKAITRQPFPPGNVAPPVDYSDLWWNAAESGWGVSLTQQYGVIFAAMYSYTANGSPTWYVVSNCALATDYKRCSGDLYSVAGGEQITSVWKGTGKVAAKVGVANFVFGDASAGTMSFTINGVQGTKAIVRQPFAAPAAKKVLFVGDSFTFGRVAPALQYNVANVSDLTAAFDALSPTAEIYELHPWGGVPGIFKRLTDQAGLNYEVSISARNATSWRGHFLNIADPVWDLRSNMAKQKWDIVVLQALSDDALPAAKSKNGNPVSFNAYLDRIEKYLHAGTGGTTTEAEIFGSLANCTASTTASPPGAGLSTTSCTESRVIPANANANPDAEIYLYQGWAKPDMVEAHTCTKSDKTSSDGAPVPDLTCVDGKNGSSTTGQSTIYYTSETSTAANLRDITTALHDAFYGRLAANRNLKAVAPVGDAFQRAVDTKVVKTDNFYNSNGTYDDSGPINLWWKDRLHASVYGSYLAGLIMYGTITELDPQALGAADKTFGELGIAAADALTLQKVAHDTLVASGKILK
jgi:hypothetical protein